MKVHTTARAIARVDPTVEVTTVDDRFRPKLETGAAVFCCVDLIESRAAIWHSKGNLTEFWVDGRMLGEVIRILVASDRTGRLYYPNTLFTAAEAEAGRCTAAQRSIQRTLGPHLWYISSFAGFAGNRLTLTCLSIFSPASSS